MRIAGSTSLHRSILPMNPSIPGYLPLQYRMIKDQQKQGPLVIFDTDLKGYLA
jgi:hypothetical protein